MGNKQLKGGENELERKKKIEKKIKPDVDGGYESPSEEIDVKGDVWRNIELLSKLQQRNADLYSVNCSTRICNECRKEVTTFYHCFFCTNYDLWFEIIFFTNFSCECYQSKKFHLHDEDVNKNSNFFHEMKLSNYKSMISIESKPSSCERMIETFDQYKNRYFIGNRNSLKEKIRWCKYSEVYDMVKNFAKGIQSVCSLNKGDHVSILSRSSLEWIVSDFSFVFLGCVSVPIHHNLSFEEKEYIIKLTKIRVLIVSVDFYEESLKLQENIKTLEKVIVIGGENLKGKFFSFNEVMENGKKSKIELKPIFRSREEIVCVVFTSGSTGLPKGVCYTEKNFRNRAPRQRIFPLVELLFVSPSHSSGRFMILTTFKNGGRFLILTKNKMENLFTDFGDIHPTHISFPPRCLNFIYEDYKKNIKRRVSEEKGKTIRKIKSEIFEELKEKNILGTRIQMISVGGGPTLVKIKRFARMLFEVPVYEGYGCTECGSIVFNSNKMKQIKLESVPELGYFVDDKPYPRGEILVEDNGCVNKYFVEEENNRIVNGWYHTHDIGENRDGNIVVIDRMSNVIKLAHGEFISLSEIERFFIENCNVKQIVVFPNKLRTKLYAIVVPIDRDVDEKKFFEKMVQDAVEGNLKGFKIPQRIILTKEEFKVENNLLTVSNKLNRKKILRKFKIEIDRLMNVEIEDWLESNTNIKKIEKNKTIRELGIDSISIINLLKNLKNINKEISYSDLVNTNVSNLVDCIKEKKEEYFTSFKEEEGKMKNFLQNLKCENSGKINSVFLTGSTGFLGKFLLKKLLKREDIFVHIHLRRNSERKISPLIQDYKSRVVVHYGDLSLPFLGLTKDQFEELKNKIDIIIHCGCYVNHFLSYNDMYEVNVGSIYEIMKLERPIHYISSISSFSSLSSTEKDIFKQKHFIDHGYPSTKWICECLLLKYFPNSVIHRLNLVGWSKITGEFNEKDWFCRTIVEILRTKFIPPCENDIIGVNMYSVDFVSDVIIDILFSRSKIRQFNYSNHKNINFKKIVEFVGKYFEENKENVVKFCKFEEWVKEMKVICNSPFLGVFERKKRIGPIVKKAIDKSSLVEFLNSKEEKDYNYQNFLKLVEKWKSIK